MHKTTWILCLLVSFGSFCQNKTPSKVIEVTLYNQGALITRELNCDLKKGENSFVIRGISPEIDKNSIQIKTFDQNALVTGYIHQSSVFSDEDSNDKIIEIGKKTNVISTQKKKFEIEVTLLDRQEKLLLENQKVGGTYSGMKPEDLIKTFDYFENRMKAILNQQFKIRSSMDSLDSIIKIYNKEINEIQQSSDNKLSEIIISLKSEKELSKSKIWVTYFVKNAGWQPTYDFIATELNQPLRILYKSKIFQYSGEDWPDINLTLSNSLPLKNSTAPEIIPWYWGNPNDYSRYFESPIMTATDNEVWGKVMDKEGQPIPGVSILLTGTSFGVSTDVNGNYRLTIPSDRKGRNNELIFSFIGYETEKRKVISNPLNVTLKEDMKSLQEVVVTGYSTTEKRNATTAVSVLQGRAAGINVTKSEETITLINEKEKPISVDFTFQEKVTLLSDGKDKVLDMKELSIMADYQYISVPKVDEAVFLKANIMDYEKFNFLDGEANVFFEGTLVGKTKLQAKSSDTLTISLGRDPSIKIERKQIKSFTKKQTLGSNRNDEFEYEINIKNTKSQELKLIVIDQFPISGNKDIEVSSRKISEGVYDEKDGKITFNITMKPLSEKKLSLSYAVKYPKNFRVQN